MGAPKVGAAAHLHELVPGGSREEQLELGRVFYAQVEAADAERAVVVQQPRLKVGWRLDHRDDCDRHAEGGAGVGAGERSRVEQGRRRRQDEHRVGVAGLHVVGRLLGLEDDVGRQQVARRPRERRAHVGASVEALLRLLLVLLSHLLLVLLMQRLLRLLLQRLLQRPLLQRLPLQRLLLPLVLRLLLLRLLLQRLLLSLERLLLLLLFVHSGRHGGRGGGGVGRQ